MSEEPAAAEELVTAPPTVVAHPIERALVDEMRGIVRGNVAMVPRFVRDLVRYFEDGARPGMPPAEMAQHLTTKAGFVLGALFRLPEVSEAPAAPAVLTAADEGDIDTAAPPSPARLTTTTTSSPPPRWFDVVVGMCLLTSAWKWSAALGVLQLCGDVSMHAYAALALLFCARAAPPTLVGALGDALVLWTALDTHAKRYATVACAASALCAAARTLAPA